MTVRQLVGEQEPGKRETRSVAEKIAPLTRAKLSGSPSGNHHARNRGASRREFLIYLWAGTLAAMTMGSGVAAYQFLYPRQRMNEFGGKFHLGVASTLPPVGSEPQANVYGKFWLSNTEKGPRAFFEICTFPWPNNPQKYWWDSARSRFECPFCGSKFSLEGHYIDGPAPRSLDQFEIEIMVGRTIVAKSTLVEGAIESPHVPSPEAEIVVNTGKLFEGLPRNASPLLQRYQG